MILDSHPVSKRSRFTPIDRMDAEAIKAKFEAAKEKYGQAIRVFETSTASTATNHVPSTEEEDDYYEFTSQDFYRLTASKKEDKYLKTKKIRDAEEEARRSKLPKAVIRVRFPDNSILESTFKSSDKIQSLLDLVKKVIAQPDLPFYLYTTPPKKQIKDFSQDFHVAGFVPGAIVHFSYDLPKGDNSPSGPFLQEDVLSLMGLEMVNDQADKAVEPAEGSTNPNPEQKPVASATGTAAAKKTGKPKWLKM
ncbi:plant UBX domain-containing protein 1 [Impatiens glandulifera]|uniref:plant UBX domain-containing protein 1 n=1 Tax=Impatiens glandulifera TaxID=253017 RepID=UPI001FB09E27|nr:plant UBX domain-containing protein 1 [Impatiens glandulifera]